MAFETYWRSLSIKIKIITIIYVVKLKEDIDLFLQLTGNALLKSLFKECFIIIIQHCTSKRLNNISCQLRHSSINLFYITLREISYSWDMEHNNCLSKNGHVQWLIQNFTQINYIYSDVFPSYTYAHICVCVLWGFSGESGAWSTGWSYLYWRAALCPRPLLSNSTPTTNPQSLPLYIVSVSKTLHCNEFIDLGKLCLIYFRQDEQKRQSILFISFIRPLWLS